MAIASFVAVTARMPRDLKDHVTSVRLTRKLAEAIDGVDLSHNKVGDQLDLTPRDARMLIAEGWASPCEIERAEADDASSKPPPRGSDER